MENNQEQIIEVALGRLEQEGLWFTTKEDKLYANAKDLYKLDQYGELEVKSKERLVSEVEQYLGDGAGFIIEAVDQWIQDNLAEGILGYVDTLTMNFEIKEVVEETNAYDEQGVIDLETTVAEEADEPEKEKKEEGKKVEAYYYNWEDDIIEVEASEANDDIWYAVAENMQRTEPEYKDWDVFDIMSDIICIWKIEKRSRLYDYLLKWYGSEEELLKNVRDVYDTNYAIYFVTGVGYSIFSADLLGGTADGNARREFDQFVNNGGKRQEESKKITEGLYDKCYKINDREELKEIALNAIYIANNDKKIIDELNDRLVDIEKEECHDELVAFAKAPYDFVANNYSNMPIELLREIALNAVYVADNDEAIQKEIDDRKVESKKVEESVTNDSQYYIDVLNELKEAFKSGYGDEDEEIKAEVIRTLDDAPDGTEMYRVTKETVSGWTSHGGYSDEYTKLVPFIKSNGVWKYGSSNRDVEDAMLSVLYNSGEFMTKEAAEAVKAEKEKDDKSYHRDIVDAGVDGQGDRIGISTNRVTNKNENKLTEELYVCYEEPFADKEMSKAEWEEFYDKEIEHDIDKDGWETFEDWWTDMLDSKLIVEESKKVTEAVEDVMQEYLVRLRRIGNGEYNYKAGLDELLNIINEMGNDARLEDVDKKWLYNKCIVPVIEERYPNENLNESKEEKTPQENIDDFQDFMKENPLANSYDAFVKSALKGGKKKKNK